MRPLARFALLVIMTFLASAGPALAGSDWTSPVPIQPPLLGYGATYAFGDSTRTHSGVDLAADAGETVRAVADATVSFAGAVPAADGGTVLAVTLDLGDGLRVTLMPLARLDVAKGAAVAQGDRIGDVAASGDASSVTPHLHVGVTLNGARVDPASLLPAAVVAGDEQPATSGGSVPAPATVPAAAVPRAQVPAAVSVPAPAPARSSSRAAASAARPLEFARPARNAAPEAHPDGLAAAHKAAAAIPAATATSLATHAGDVAMGPATALAASAPGSLLPLAAQMAVAQERAVPSARLPDVSAIRVVRGIGLRVVVGLAGTLASAIGIARLARVRRLVPAAVPASSR